MKQKINTIHYPNRVTKKNPNKHAIFYCNDEVLKLYCKFTTRNEGEQFSITYYTHMQEYQVKNNKYRFTINKHSFKEFNKYYSNLQFSNKFNEIINEKD